MSSRLGALICCGLLTCGAATSQSYLRGAGSSAFDSSLDGIQDFVEISAGSQFTLARRANGEVIGWGANSMGQCNAPEFGGSPPVQLAAGYSHSMVLRADGSLVGFGYAGYGALVPPPLPAGVTWTQVKAGMTVSFGLRSDGRVESWGGWSQTHPAPNYAIPLVEIAAGTRHAAARLADGRVVVWGPQYNLQYLPAPPAGQTFTKIAAGDGFTAGLLSGGTIVVATSNNWNGEANVPPLPAGVVYTSVAAGEYSLVALRSDGQLVSWGRHLGVTAPVLPAGVHWVQAAIGLSVVVGLRSDGRISIWPPQNFNPGSLRFAPAHPIGRSYVEVAAGVVTLARDSQGDVVAWGASGSLCVVPPLAPGSRWTAIAAGALLVPGPEGNSVTGHSLGLDSAGAVHAWGNNGNGQCNVPPLPPATVYTAIAAGGEFSLALRSDGAVVPFGNLVPPPPLPAGTTYVEIAAGSGHGLARRSDGVLVQWRNTGVQGVPVGSAWVQIAAGLDHSVALRNDGFVVCWGDNLHGQCNVIPAPPGLYYVEVTATSGATLARRSDGQVIAWGRSVGTFDHAQQTFVRPLPAGQSYVEIDGGYSHTVMRVGPTQTYARFGPGCAGSMPAARLVPQGTPAIAQPFRVRLLDLPTGAALVITGLDTASSSFGLLPLPLAGLGMPGCTAFVSNDLVTLVVGTGTQAELLLPIPNSLLLVGASFYQQAIVPDPAAGNALGAVISEAMAGVIGR
jgi:alpha-tubulin suppressor-like RCC1 family protein